MTKTYSIIMAILVAHSALAKEPNRFECEGEQYKATYWAPLSGDAPMLSIGPARDFVIQPITDFETTPGPFGTIYSAIIETIPDLYIERLSIVLPRVNLMESRNSLTFDSLVIRSQHHTSIGGEALVDGLVDQVLDIATVSCTAMALEP